MQKKPIGTLNRLGIGGMAKAAEIYEMRGDLPDRKTAR